MSRNIHHQTAMGLINSNRTVLKYTRQKPLAFHWWTPDCSATDDAGQGCTGDEPPLINNWAQPDPPLEKFAFRLHTDGSLEFKGHLDASGAASGTVAFVLPGLYTDPADALPDFRPPNDQFFHTTITTDDGTSFSLAQVHIDSDTGEVTIVWPAT